MSKILKHPYILLAGLVLLLASLPAFVAADENSLIVDFQETPLFDEANFLPGNSVTRFARVTNNTGETKRIAIEAINTTGSNDLADVLNMRIVEGTAELYNDTLSNFFGAGEIFLSELAGNGIPTQYDLTVSFQSLASDPELWEESLGFNILIGFQGEGGGGSFPTSGGGGVGSILPRGLVIQSESVEATEIGETSVTILWTTSFSSTSQVIYAAAGEPRGLDLSAPNFGYPHAFPDPEDLTKITGHSVIITGLTPETTYFFRAVSHASPLTITIEYTFATLSLGEISSASEQTLGVLPDQDKGLAQAGEGVVDDKEAGISDTGEELPRVAGAQGEEETSSRRGPNAFVAGVGLFDTPFLLVVALAIILLLFLLFRKRKKEQDRR